MPRAVEVRQVRPVPLFDPPPVPPIAHTWIKAIGAMPDDQALHCAVLAYASDTTLLDIAFYPHGVSWISPKVQQASLSHGMWFHRPFRIDEWLLYSQHVASSAGGRAIARGSVFTRDGALVASVVQEGLSQIAPQAIALGGDRRCRRTVNAGDFNALGLAQRRFSAEATIEGSGKARQGICRLCFWAGAGSRAFGREILLIFKGNGEAMLVRIAHVKFSAHGKGISFCNARRHFFQSLFGNVGSSCSIRALRDPDGACIVDAVAPSRQRLLRVDGLRLPRGRRKGFVEAVVILAGSSRSPGINGLTVGRAVSTGWTTKR